ncbi:MAG: CPBP family intramembrane glutamic endopeptidase, partial [Planctomycetaceae bacterium]
MEDSRRRDPQCGSIEAAGDNTVRPAADACLTAAEPLPVSPLVVSRPWRIPGPGLVESAVWTIGVPCVHLAAVLGMVLAIAITGELLPGAINARDLIDPGQKLMLPVLLSGEMLIFVIVAVTAVVLRLGTQPGRKLALNGFCTLHGLILVALMLPVSIVSGELYRVTDADLWQPLTDAFPLLSMLDNANSMNSISDLAGRLPLPGLLLCLAVAPAIGEEIVCRGLIGRGLIARWGLPLGVLGTTLLFAAIHVHPVHVVGVIPLGLCMHVLYVSTRSFWAPVCFHFLNNAWACWMMTEQLQVAEPVAEAGVELTGLILAGG